MNSFTNPLVIVCVLFFVSLLAAFVLFFFLKSTALVKTKQYQAGGALAGFLIVFFVSNNSYTKISNFQEEIKKQQSTIQDLGVKIDACNQFTSTRDISGTVDPYSEQTKIVLGIAEADLPINKRFRISSPCFDLKKGKYALYVIREGRNYPYEIFPDENISSLDIKVPSK
ncbi:MAG: hypothetical protein LAO21_21110 [Acidobacteriia bacterium]|nr:hypothetical protein [Terriglobia bacterium]